MDYEALQALADELGGAISAHRFALESLFAMWLEGLGGGPENARTIGSEMLRQFEELPPRIEGVDPERLFTVTQIGIHHLERMWAMIEWRLKQALAAREADAEGTSLEPEEK